MTKLPLGIQRALSLLAIAFLAVLFVHWVGNAWAPDVFGPQFQQLSGGVGNMIEVAIFGAIILIIYTIVKPAPKPPADHGKKKKDGGH